MNPDIVAEQMKFAQIVNLKTAKHARFCGAARSPTRIIEITIRDVTQRSGRVEARIGLRMMPTFPRSPLSFRTVGFPQYGWKAGFPSGAFLGDQRLKPAPGIRRPPSSLRPPFVHLLVTSITPYCAGSRTRIAHRLGG
jgi:hypothetical protein